VATLDPQKFENRGALTLRKGTRTQKAAAALAAVAKGDEPGYAIGEYRQRLLGAGFSVWVREWDLEDEKWCRMRMGEGGAARASCYHVLLHKPEEGERSRCIGHRDDEECAYTLPNVGDGERRVRYDGDERYTQPLSDTWRATAQQALAEHVRALAQQGASVTDMLDTPGIRGPAEALGIDMASAVRGREIDPWDEFVESAQEYVDSGLIDSEENDYKIRIGQRVAEAREAALAESSNWADVVKSSIGGNLIFHIALAEFRDWIDDAPAESLSALRALWRDGDASVSERVRAFTEFLPRSAIGSVGARTNIASVLLMGVDVRDYPPFRVTLFDEAYKRIGYTQPNPGTDEAALYNHALGFLDRFIDEASERGLTLRDRLDAQSVMWAIRRKTDEPSSDEGGETGSVVLATDLDGGELKSDVSTFGIGMERAKRAAVEGRVSTPQTRQYWWVNQGGTNQQEIEGGYLWAPLKSAGGRELGHHQSMADLRVGDVVFHYRAGHIRAISGVTQSAILTPLSNEPPDEEGEPSGRRALVDVAVLGDSVSLNDIPIDWRLEEGGPFNSSGSIKQGYLFPLSGDFVAKLAGRFPQLAERVAIEADVQSGAPAPYLEPDLETIRSRIEAEGLVVSERTLRRFHLSLRSRGFVILSGISGTGKTWLARAYARAVGGRGRLVAVAPNWTTNEDLVGYFNPLREVYYDTPFSNFLREAAIEWESAVGEQRTPVPYYLVLDEMNLARVEYYFATFLSAMEERQREESASIQLAEEEVPLMPNLRFVGTVNVDETTHGFADKVYDRAQLVELEAPRQAMERHLDDSPLAETLLSAWDALHEVAPFAFRVIDDITSYVEEARALGVEVEAALDEQMLQKLLPKVHGIDPRIEQALAAFIELCGERFPLSAEKAHRMRIRFNEHGSVSYFA